MKTRHSLLISILLIPLLGYSRTPNWEVLTLNHQLYQNVAFNQLSGDTLVVQAYGKTFEIPVDSIETVRDVNKSTSNSVSGFLIGALGGGIVGNSLIPAPKPGWDHMLDGVFNPIIYTASGIILGSLLGVVVGSNITSNAFYDFQKMDHAQKIEAINQLMQPYAMKPIFWGS